jgi:Tfp pilus assembly protein PilN
MRAVNLLPDDRRGSRHASPLAVLRRQPLLLLAIVVSIAVVAGLGFELRSATSTVSAHQQTLRDLETELAKLPKAPQTSSQVTTQRASRGAVVTTVAAQRTTWDGFLSALSRVIPEDVWLLNLSASAASTSSVPGGSAPTAFTVSGYTYSQPSVARLMRRLRLVPWLNDISLSTSSKTSLNDHVVYQFTLGANVVSIPEVKS